MDKEDFLQFVDHVSWRFAKSVPNWPHFYIVQNELADQAAFQASKQFVREFGRDGKFFDMDVRYYEADGWTYWTSQLGKPLESQYMLNRCKTEYTYESLAKAGKLPLEGFRESIVSLAPVLEDPEFKSLVRDAEGGEFSVFAVLGTSDYEIRHSNVLSWLLDPNANHGQGSSFLDLLWKQISGEHELPNLFFCDYSVDREGGNEDQKIDLLLTAEDREWMIVIENKLFSPETGDQLDRYFRYIEHRYSEVRHRIYFYLTPDGIAPARQEDSANWIPISYLAVKWAVSRFLEKPLPDRIRDFLAQYLEHIERNVFKSTGMIEKQRNLLRRHAKTFHSLAFLLEEKSVQTQCSDVEFNLLKSVLAVQHEVERELFDFTKRMMAKHGYARYSGLGHWITIEPPGLKAKLIERGLLGPKEALPIVFAFESRPNSFVVEIWLYKNKALFFRLKGRISRLSEEGPEPNRGDEHLVEVLYRKTIIRAADIIHSSLSELKDKIATYFEADLKRDLEESAQGVGNMVDSIRSKEKPGRVATEPAA
jgi:hypothetical protein